MKSSFRFPFRMTWRRFAVFVFDAISVFVAYVGAFFIRFDFAIPEKDMAIMLMGLPWILGIQIPVLLFSGLYRGIWHFASLRDLLLIIRSTGLAVLLSLAAVAMVQRIEGWPRSIFILDAVLLVLILGGARFAYRYLRESVLIGKKEKKNVLILGAGQTGTFIAKEFSSAGSGTRIAGYLDDNKRLIGLRINNAPVLGPVENLKTWIQKKSIDEVIIAIPSLEGKKIKEIVVQARSAGIPCRICPPIRDVLMGKVKLNQLRKIDVEDLLRRDVVKIDEKQVGSFISGRTILITGAGGSIGSELCRQVIRYNPKQVVFFERSEFNLYRIEKEFRDGDLSDPSIIKKFVIGDVLDQAKIEWLFAKYKPEVVLHAAAYKHVPIMEENIYDAVRNNVLGTYRLTKAAGKHGVEKFVLVSTDKAVRPTSVMGASKRMAEIVCQAAAKDLPLQAFAVRFGNVLDSEGSVLPLFRDQIARGGPITVTHPDTTRFFMTIPEASLLVLQAAAMGKGEEVYLLDMGEPVLIRDMAEELISLSGLIPYKDIDIVFTGLRKGEKLHEELLIDIKNAEKTSHPKIVVSETELAVDLPDTWYEQLLHYTDRGELPSKAELITYIKRWVPEYELSKAFPETSVSQSKETGAEPATTETKTTDDQSRPRYH